MDKDSKAALRASQLFLYVTVLYRLKEARDAVVSRQQKSLLQSHINEQHNLNRSLPVQLLRPTFYQFAATVSIKTDGKRYGQFAGLVDGRTVMWSPKFKDVRDPWYNYDQKGFFGLNVQATCDEVKRFRLCNLSNMDYSV